MIYHTNQEYLDKLKSHIEIIQDEVNCLEFYFELSAGVETELKIKPNNKALGMKFRNDMQKIKQMLSELDQKFLNDHLTSETLKLDNFVLSKDDYEIVKINKSDNNQCENLCSHEMDGLKITANMKYDTVTHELYQIRKFVIFVQNIRKTLGLRPWNDIALVGQQSCSLINEFMKYDHYVQSRLKTSIAFTKNDICEYTFVWESIDGITNHVCFDVIVKN
jgi:6-pyruvoyl-tetrahydropterin synthase